MKKTVLIIVAVLVIALLVCALIYTRPMTLAQLCPGVDVSQSEAVRGYYFTAPGVEDTYYEIDKDDERFSRIIEAFATRKFRRSLTGLLSNGTKTHLYQDGDFKWELMFVMEDVEFPDGNIHSGPLSSVSYFFGALELHYNGDTWRFSTNG